MNPVVFSIASIFVSLYTMIIVARLVTEWLPGIGPERLIRYIRIVTDPFLNLFRRIRFLHVGPIDFSALTAITLLNIMSITLSQWGATGKLDALFAVITVSSLVLNTFAFMALLLALIITVRIILILMGKVSYIGSLIDQLVQPVAYRLVCLMVKREVSYQAQLIIFGSLLFLFAVITRLISAWFLHR